MSIKVRAKAHPFKAEYTDFYCEAAPLSELYTLLNSPLGISHARFLIDDAVVTDLRQIPPDGSTVYINVVPGSSGSETKDAGKVMFLGGLGAILLGIGLLFTGFGAGAGIALIGTGVGMMFGGAALFNMEIPTPSFQDTGSKMESVRGSKNQARKHGYIPVLFGRHLITPDVAALPYTEIDASGQQWLAQLFCAGYNDMTVELGSLKVGDTALVKLSETKNITAILAGTDARVKMEIIQDGAASALYPFICVEQQFNSTLKHNDDDGVLTPIVHTTADKTTRINVDIFFPQGLVAYTDKGKKESTSVRINIQYKQESAPDSAYTVFPGWNQNISAETADMFRRQATVQGLSPGKYTVKIERITADSTDTKTINVVYAGSIRAYADDRPVQQGAAQSLTIIALKIRASALASGVIDNFNLVAQSTIPDYNASSDSWTTRLTKNPASALLYALRGKINPAPVADADIDWDSLKEFWTFCAQKGYTCNAVQGDRELFSTLCAKIAKTGRASVLRMDGKFSVVIDKERPAPVQLFSPRNTTGYRQTIIKADIPDEIAVEFIDETSGWTSNERSVYNTQDGLSGGTEKTKQTSSIWGITHPDTVFKFARYQLACAKNRPIIHTLECDIEYLLCKKGDLIEYSGDAALTGIAYGKVTSLVYSDSSVIGVTADTAFPQEAGRSYGIRCRKSSGQIVTLGVENRETNDNFLSFETPQPAATLEEGDLIIFGLTGKITRQLIITEIAPSGGLNASLTCVDYSPEIFAVDNPAYIVPPFDNKITTDGSITDSGIASITEWQTWFTYHDSLEMPDRPAGGGTSAGWHRYQTPESRWVSLKTAKSLSDGEWSAPAQTSFMVDESLRHVIAGNSPDVGRPDNITGLKAAAGKDTVHITWDPLGNGLANAVKHIRIEIKKTAAGDWTAAEVGTNDFVYDFDRSTDGYPEKSDLAIWRVRAKAVNIYGLESLAYSPDAGGLAVDTSAYGTWKPAVPVLIIAASGRTVSVDTPSQAWYGAAGCEYQISKPVSGTPWYAPAMADTQTVYADESAWKAAEGGVCASGAQLTQQLPLEGQAAGTPKDTAYKYRARALTKAYDGSVMYRSAWSAEAAALAKGTGVKDVVKNAIGTAQLQQRAVTNVNIDDATIDYEKFNPAVKPPRKVTALPAYPYTGYVQGDTVIVISGITEKDEKMYRLVNPAVSGTTGWTKAVDGTDLVAQSVTAAKIAANTVSTANLNVLAKNVVNPFIDGTLEGWTTGGTVVNVDGLGYVLNLSQARGKNLQSNIFTVLPDDLYEFKFGIESLTALSDSLGLYLGLTADQIFDRYIYSFPNKVWLLQPSFSNAYFLFNYITQGRKYYTTYILGSRVTISSVPAPAYTDETYSIYCLRLTGTDTSCRIRAGYNSGVPNDAAWYLIQPQVYRIGDGGVIAQNIITKDLSAISASLGRVTGDGNANDSQYKLVLSDGFSGNENKKGTLLLGSTSDSAYLRRWWDGSFWHMAIKLATFIVDSIASNIVGRFRIFRTGQSTDSDKPVLDSNPGSAAGSEATDARGAFRVRKSTAGTSDGETVVFEALPSGNVNIPIGTLSAKYVGNAVNHPVSDNGKIVNNLTIVNSILGTSFLLVSKLDGLDAKETKKGFAGAMYFHRGTTNYFNDCDMINIVCTKAYHNYYLSAYGISGHHYPVVCVASYQGEYYLAVMAQSSATYAITFDGHLFGDFVGQMVQDAEMVDLGALTVYRGAVFMGPTHKSYTKITGDMIELYQGGVMKASAKLGLVAGTLGLLINGLLVGCDGFLSQGDIKAEIDAPEAPVWTAAALPSSDYWYDIAYGNDKFVAIAYNSNKAAYSTNGVTWTETTLPSEANWRSIAYGDGKFVVIAYYNSNKAAYSTDGVTWTETTLPSSDYWQSVTYGNGKFVAVANNSNKAAYSTDGVTWTETTLPSSNKWFDIAYGNGKFVVVTSNANQAAYSTNGVAWTETTLPSSDYWQSITYGNGKFVAVATDSNKAAYSTNQGNVI